MKKGMGKEAEECRRGGRGEGGDKEMEGRRKKERKVGSARFFLDNLYFEENRERGKKEWLPMELNPCPLNLRDSGDGLE